MRRFIALLLVAVLCLGLVTTASAADKKKISIWHIQTQEDQKEVFELAKARFEALYPDYEVEISVFQNDAYKTKIQVALAAGEEPDIFVSWSGGPMIEYVNANQLLDLTPYMEKDNYKDIFMDAALNQSTYDGKIWGVPVENISVALFFCNKEVFESNNVAPPTTLAELEAACEVFKANGIAPFALANATKWTGSMYYMYLVDRIGGSDVFMNAANKFVEDGFKDEAFTKAGEKLQEWVKAGYFNEGFNGIDEDNGQARMLLYSNQAAMYLMGSWAISTFSSENPDFLDNMFIMNFPVVEGGVGDPTAVVGTVGDNFYHVSPNSAEPEMAFEYLKTCLDADGIAERVAIGKIPPLKDIEVNDANLQKVLDVVGGASSVQLWYDQYMNTTMSEMHKDTSQALLGLTMTPAEVNEAMQKLIEEQ